MLITEDQLQKSYTQPQIPLEPELNSTTFAQELGAAFRQENVVGSFFANKPYNEPFTSASDLTQNPDYDVWSEIEARDLEPYANSFIDVSNPEQFEVRAQKIERQLADRKLLSNAGASGVAASIVAGVFDPINLVPIGGTAVKGIKGSKTALQAVVSTAKVAAPSIALQESLLNSTQETRTLEESVVNVTAGTVLAGALSGGLTAVSRSITGSSVNDIALKWETDLVNTNEAVAAAETELYRAFATDDSVGAARAFRTTLQQETLSPSLGVGSVTKGITKTLSKAVGKEGSLEDINPVLRLADSPVKGVREFAQDLIDQPLFFNKNFEGIPSPQAIENLRFEQDVRSAKIVQGFSKAFKDHKKAFKGTGRSSLNAMEFRQAVSYALRNGDIGATNEITQLAKTMRSEILEPLKEKAIKLKLLPEDVSVTTADSYFTRMYNKEKIIQNADGFKDTVKQWAGKKVKQIREDTKFDFDKRINKARAQLGKATKGTEGFKELEQKLIDLEVERRLALEVFDDPEDYIDNIADDLFVKLTGIDRQPLLFELTIAEHGPLKDRTWDIQDNLVQEFLENDAELVLEHYNRAMTGQTLLQERFGTLNFDEASKPIIDEFNDVLKTVPENQKAKVTRQFDRNLKDLKMLWDLTNGTYRSALDYDNIFVKGAQDIRTLNYMRLLGQVTVSSFPDTANLVLVNGYKRLFGDLLIPVVRNLRKLRPALDELNDAGLGMEAVLNSRVQTLMEIGDPTARGTYFSRSMNNMSTVFSKLSGITYWNDMMKNGAGIITQNRVIKNSKAIAAGKTLGKNEDAFMRWLGFNNADMKQIATLHGKHGGKQDGLFLSGAAKWENDAVARKFRAALNKNVNSTIVTKGLGDAPAVANSELGRSWLQFQNFTFAAHQRITLRSAQRLAQGDQAVLQGLTSLIGMGMMVAYLKAEGFRKGSTSEWTTDKWLIEGIDRSGVIPVLMMYNNPWERVGLPGIGAGLAAVTGNEAQPVSRYAARGTAESLLGPTFGTIADTLATTHSITSGELTSNDIHRLRKLLPYQNVTGIKQLLDSIDPAVQERR